MGKLGRIVAGFVVLASVVACSGAAYSEAQTVNPDAKVLVDFQERVKQYIELHKRAAKEVPKLKETEDAAKIKSVQDQLAEKIRAARPKARQGEIFTPEIAAQLRRLMYPEMKGSEGKATKEALKEDAPSPKSVPLKVNARYPDEQPLPTVPPNLLMSLPKLPEELEYRIVQKDLILRDVAANLIVDFIPRAIQ
jgi:hypothetical protein